MVRAKGQRSSIIWSAGKHSDGGIGVNRGSLQDDGIADQSLWDTASGAGHEGRVSTGEASFWTGGAVRYIGELVMARAAQVQATEGL